MYFDCSSFITCSFDLDVWHCYHRNLESRDEEVFSFIHLPKGHTNCSWIWGDFFLYHQIVLLTAFGLMCLYLVIKREHCLPYWSTILSVLPLHSKLWSSIPETNHQQPCEVNKEVLKTSLYKWRNGGEGLSCLKLGQEWQMKLGHSSLAHSYVSTMCWKT